jgi:hypothetical protein
MEGVIRLVYEIKFCPQDFFEDGSNISTQEFSNRLEDFTITCISDIETATGISPVKITKEVRQ